MLTHVGPQALVDLLVAAFADQVQVELAERRCKHVGILDLKAATRAVIDLQPVMQRQLGALEQALEHASGVDLRQRDPGALVGDHLDARGGGAEHAHDHAAAGRMSPQH